jgi:hypothetical protein
VAGGGAHILIAALITGRKRTHAARLIALAVALLALALPAAGEAAPPGAISGTISGAGVGPLVEAEACAEAITSTATEFACAKTGPGGTYAIGGLVEGSYAVWLGPPREANFVGQYYGGSHSFTGASPVRVDPGATTPNVGATLEKGATISGVVRAAATGAPVPGVEVCASASTGGEGCGETSSLGAYRIIGLPAGTFDVEFFTYETGQNLLSQSYELGPVTLTAGQERTGVNAALVAGGQVTGTVRAAADGAPLKGVDVCLTEASEAYPLACLTTPASGAYRFFGLWAGSFKVVFSPEASELEEGGFWELKPDAFPTQWWNGQATFAAATPIAATPGSTVAGIDGSLGPGPVAPPAVTPPSTGTPAPAPVAAAPKPKPKPTAPKAPAKCRKGFVKKKAKGQKRCVKARRHKPRRHHFQHGGPKSVAKPGRRGAAGGAGS